MSADGKIVPKDCNSCHTILEQKDGAVRSIAMEGEKYKHPVDLGDISQVNCSDCHTGGVGP